MFLTFDTTSLISFSSDPSNASVPDSCVHDHTMTSSNANVLTESRHVHEALADRFNRASTSVQLSELLGITLNAVAQSLCGVIGNGGFDALMGRTLFLCASAASWLHALHAEDGRRINLSLVGPVFAAQSRDDAVHAASQLMKTLSAVLAGIVGLSLAERLLQPVLEVCSTSMLPGVPEHE